MAQWYKFLNVLVSAAGILLLSALALIWIANPYGNLPFSPLPHVLMDDNQRFQYPAVVRSGRYDSIVIGTSTTRLLDPARLEAILGGRFANLALNSGTAWEQYRLANLFARSNPKPNTLIIGLDHVWCDGRADIDRITVRGFPEWLFDDNSWNDLAYMLNIRTIEISGRRIAHALGLAKERWPHNGYEVFVPPEAEYDLARARHNIWGPRPVARKVRPKPEPDAFPALRWLDELLDPRSGWHRAIIVIPPTHHITIPKPETSKYQRDADCQRSVVEIASRLGRPVIDFRIASGITLHDENYWDPLHYRVPIAQRIIEGLELALKTGTDDPNGDWRILANAANQP